MSPFYSFKNRNPVNEEGTIMNKFKFSRLPGLTNFVSVLAVSLICSAPLSAGIVLNFFRASDYNSNTAAMNATLGITGYQVDTFESTTLLPGLTVSMSGDAVVSPVTVASLPNLYNVNSPA